MTFRRVLPWLLVIAMALLLAGSAVAVSTTVVISEYRTRGPNGGNDEFIELRNKSGSPVDSSGWKVNGSNAAGTVGTRATIPAGVVLAPGCAYLLTNTATSGGPYSGPTPGDQTYATGVADDGGIAVLTPANAITDQVGQSLGSAYKEGVPNAATPLNVNQSYERKLKTQDTDDNATDYTYRTPADPENRSSSCGPPPPPADAPPNRHHHQPAERRGERRPQRQHHDHVL